MEDEAIISICVRYVESKRGVPRVLRRKVCTSTRCKMLIVRAMIFHYNVKLTQCAFSASSEAKKRNRTHDFWKTYEIKRT